MSDIRDIESPEVEEIVSPEDYRHETQLSVKRDQIAATDIEYYSKMDMKMIERALDNMVAFNVLLKSRVLKLTNKFDWLNIDNNPYMNIYGRRKFASTFKAATMGMSKEVTEGEDDRGKFIRVCYRAQFIAFGRPVWEIGIRTSRDPLWAVSNEKKVDADGKLILGPDGKPVYERVEKLLEDVNVGHVEKAAWTNCQSRGFGNLLCLDGFMWEELEAAGIKISDVKSFGFHGKKTASDAQKGFVQVLMKRYNRTEDDVRKIIGHGLDVLMSADVDKIKAAFEADAKVESASTAQNSRVTSDEIKRIREGMRVLGITDEEFKKKFGALPEGLKPVQVKPVLDWLNARADEKA